MQCGEEEVEQGAQSKGPQEREPTLGETPVNLGVSNGSTKLSPSRAAWLLSRFHCLPRTPFKTAAPLHTSFHSSSSSRRRLLGRAKTQRQRTPYEHSLKGGGGEVAGL